MDVVKELIERELGRNGQVFFLHNNIATLYNRVSTLQKLLPNVHIGVAHGKMDREDIERLSRTLNGLADIATRKEAEMEEERKRQKEREERRKRLYKLYYEQAPPVSWYFPKDSALLE